MKKVIFILVVLLFVVNTTAQQKFELEFSVLKKANLEKVEIKPKKIIKAQAIKGKKRVLCMFGSETFWRESLQTVQDRYISTDKIIKLKERGIRLDIDLSVDYQGNVLFVKLLADESILDLLSKECLVDIYWHFVNLNVPVPHTLSETEYCQGTVNILGSNM